MIPFAQASGHVIAAQDLVFRINDVFLFPLIALLSAVAFIVFLYGAFAYVRNAASQEGRQTGQRHLLYGLVGLLVMFSAFTILQIAAGTFGIETGPPTSSVRPEARPESSDRAPTSSVRPEARPESAAETESDTATDTEVTTTPLPPTTQHGNQTMYYNDSELISVYNEQMLDFDAPPISKIYFAKNAEDTTGKESEDCYALGGTANTLMVMSNSRPLRSVYICGK